MSNTKPYIVYFGNGWWRIKGPTRIDAFWPLESHAQSHADDMNAAYKAALSKEGAEPRVKTEAQFKALEDRVAELEQENGRFREYVAHNGGCRYGEVRWVQTSHGRGVSELPVPYECTCGLDELLNPKV